MPNLSMRNKLLLMILPPILGLLVFSWISVSEKVTSVREMKRTHQLSVLAVSTGSLVHELQKERGMTAGFITSKGAKFRTELAAQRAQVDVPPGEDPRAQRRPHGVERGGLRPVSRRTDR